MTTVAICGKGGAGKTTTAALLVCALAQREEQSILAVDADPAGGLGLALDLLPQQTVNDLRVELLAQLEQQGVEHPAASALAAEADYRLLQLLHERGPVALLSVGRSEEAGCFCKLNSFLRSSIEALGSRFDICVVDAEAGVEQVNRRVMRSVSHLLLVSDTSRKSLQVARAIHQLAEEAVADARVGLLLNRVRQGDDTHRMAEQAAVPLLGALPDDDTVRRFDAEAVFWAFCVLVVRDEIKWTGGRTLLRAKVWRIA